MDPVHGFQKDGHGLAPDAYPLEEAAASDALALPPPPHLERWFLGLELEAAGGPPEPAPPKPAPPEAAAGLGADEATNATDGVEGE